MNGWSNCAGFTLLIGFVLWVFPMKTGTTQVSEAWTARYHGALGFNDIAWDIAVDERGQIYVTGASDHNYLTIKYDSNGVELWTAFYNSSGLYEDFAKALEVDADGNVYVTGVSHYIEWGSTTDYATIKYDSSGITQWVAIYDGPAGEDDWAADVAVDDSGNVYVTGFSEGLEGYQDYATIKYNASGQEQWVARYDAPFHNSDAATHLEISPLGDIIITGSTSSDTGWTDITTIGYRTDGQIRWSATFNGIYLGSDIPSDLKIDPGGNIYVTGTGQIAGEDIDFVTIKYDTLGRLQWFVYYNGLGDSLDLPSALLVDTYGNSFVTGGSWGGESQYDYATVKYNTLGELQWVARYNGSDNEQDLSAAVVVDSSGNVYVTGTSNGWDNFVPGDYATIKYNSSGQEQWVMTYDGPVSLPDVPHAMALDAAGNIYVTGESAGIGYWPYYRLDYLTIKYDQSPSGVNPLPKSTLVEPFTIKSPYPNPFNATTTLQLEVSQPEGLSIQLFNLEGQSLGYIQEGENLPAGLYTYVIDASNWASGIYFYSIKSSHLEIKGRLVLLK